MQHTESLLAQLEKNKKWPLRYMFKFVAPNDDTTVATIKEELPKSEQTTCKLSKNGKYVAITCIAMMPSAQEIVDISTKIGSMKGVMAL